MTRHFSRYEQIHPTLIERLFPFFFFTKYFRFTSKTFFTLKKKVCFLLYSVKKVLVSDPKLLGSLSSLFPTL